MDDLKYLTWVEIDQGAIKFNIDQFKKIISSKVKIMVVVKSNAYGHGMAQAAQLALGRGIDYLGVINTHEALLLRKVRIQAPIMVLSYFDGNELEEAIIEDIELPLYDLETAKLLSKIAENLGKTIKVHIKIDTGTSRIGILAKEGLDFIKKVKSLSSLEIQGVFSHLASSEDFDQTYTNKQIREFKDLITKIKRAKIRVPLFHLGCSASTLINPQSHFDMVRIGISVYGLWPSSDAKKLVKKKRIKLEIKPALSWKTRIIQVKEVPKGTFIGYGCTYKTRRKTKLAVLPMGYWEGYDRKLSNQGEVLISGKRVKILGRVCMNLTMIDITDIQTARVGDEVVLIGKQGPEEITADEIAEKIDTINYEVVTRINPLLPRIYK